MGLSQDRILYGIHSMSPRNRATKLPYGILKVIGSCNLALTSDLEQLYAGSNKFAWAAESKTTKTDLAAKVKAYPGFLFSLFLGASVTDNAADAAGTISTPVNALGTSIIKPTTGIATIAVKAAQKANLKYGQYVIKALTANTLGIYLMSDIDSNRGTAASYADDSLKLTLATVTIVTVTGTDIDSLGMTITGGSSATAFTIGDTAYFQVSPPSSKSTDIIVGASGATMPDFENIMYAQKRATGEMFEIIAHNCVGTGLPISLEEMAFSQAELKMTCLYDSGLNRVFTIRDIQPT